MKVLNLHESIMTDVGGEYVYEEESNEDKQEL